MEKYIGVIFEKNFTMREFKAQIFLLLSEYDEALELLEYSEDKLGHIIVELARMEELELDFEDYEDAMYNIFTQERVQKALRILDGDDFIINTTLHSDYHNMLAMYDRLESKKA
jgi:ribosomal protein S12 methylthiotransferase accessory factor